MLYLVAMDCNAEVDSQHVADMMVGRLDPDLKGISLLYSIPLPHLMNCPVSMCRRI